MECWAERLRQWLGGTIPRDYLTVDCETTGLRRDFDLPIDFGYTVVRDGEATQRGSFLLDWTRRPEWADPAWLQESLVRLKGLYAARGQGYPYSPRRLRKEGVDPLHVFRFALDLLRTNHESGGALVGHNLVFFDAEMLRNCFLEFLGEEWELDSHRVLDTGITEKACRLSEKDWPNVWVPAKGESLVDFFRRVYEIRRRGVRWSLEVCIERYNLARRFGIDPAEAHTAGFDSYVCHLLLECWRREARL